MLWQAIGEQERKVEQESKSYAWIHLILFLITVVWAFNNIVMKIGFTYVSPSQFSGIRMIIALPVMLYFAFWNPGRKPFAKIDILRISLLGIIGLGVFQTLFPIGLNETSAPLGGMLMATMPIHVVILSLLFRLEKPQWKSIVGVLLTILGLSLIMAAKVADETNTQTTLKGIAFVVLGEFGYAINTTFLRPFMKRYQPLQVTGLSMAVSVLFFLLVYRKDMLALEVTQLPWQVWASTIFSGLIAFLLANTIWNYSVRLIGSTQVSVYGNLAPVFVMILSAIFFGNVLSGGQLLGALIIFAGVVLVQLRRQESASKPKRNTFPSKREKYLPAETQEGIV